MVLRVVLSGFKSGDLVYKFRKIIGKIDFPYHFKKIIVRYKKIGYNINVMRRLQRKIDMTSKSEVSGV